MIPQLWKHDRNTDVAMERLHTFHSVTERIYHIRCRWWNIVNPKQPFLCSLREDQVRISVEKMPEWKPWN